MNITGINLMMWSSIFFLVLSCASAVICRLAYKGKVVDNHPICGQCGYDLCATASEEVPLASACPECGSEINGHVRTRIGNRRPMRALFSLALILCICFLSISVFLSLRLAYQRDFEWIRYQFTSTLVAEASKHPNSSVADEALEELLRRQRNGEFAESESSFVIQAALEYQADLSKPWDSRWGSLVSTARMRDSLADKYWRRYISQSMPLKMLARKKIHEGDPILLAGIILGTGPRRDMSLIGHPVYDPDAHYKISKVIDGVVSQDTTLDFKAPFGLNVQRFSGHKAHDLDKLNPGDYEIAITLQYDCPEPYGQLGTRKPLQTNPVTYKTNILVHRQKEQLIKPVNNKKDFVKFYDSLFSSFAHRDAAVSRFDTDSGKLYVEYKMPSSPANNFASFDIEIYHDSVLLDDGSSIVFYPESHSQYVPAFYRRSFSVDSPKLLTHGSSRPLLDYFTIRLIPNPMHLKNELFGYTYLNHVFEMKNIAVQWDDQDAEKVEGSEKGSDPFDDDSSTR